MCKAHYNSVSVCSTSYHKLVEQLTTPSNDRTIIIDTRHGLPSVSSLAGGCSSALLAARIEKKERETVQGGEGKDRNCLYFPPSLSVSGKLFDVQINGSGLESVCLYFRMPVTGYRWYQAFTGVHGLREGLDSDLV